MESLLHIKWVCLVSVKSFEGQELRNGVGTISVACDAAKFPGTFQCTALHSAMALTFDSSVVEIHTSSPVTT